MDLYHKRAATELKAWQKQMMRRPGFFNSIAARMQARMNRLIPEKIHEALTATIKQMIRGVLFGAGHTTAPPVTGISLQAREEQVFKKVEYYRQTAAIEGGITGAGGLLLGLADFPILIAIKIKFLFDIASLYGFDPGDYRERMYLLHIFELAFSSHAHRRNVYQKMVAWDEKSKALPADIHDFDWRSFQQEYRDYIDLAKLAQLLPVIGAPVGFLVNSKLMKKLGVTAMNAYRMRLL